MLLKQSRKDHESKLEQHQRKWFDQSACWRFHVSERMMCACTCKYHMTRDKLHKQTQSKINTLTCFRFFERQWVIHFIEIEHLFKEKNIRFLTKRLHCQLIWFYNVLWKRYVCDHIHNLFDRYLRQYHYLILSQNLIFHYFISSS